MPAALQVAKSHAWANLDRATRIRYVRLLVVLSLQAGQMRSAPPRPDGPEGRIEYGIFHPRMYRDVESLEIASTVLRTLQMVVPPGRYSVQSVTTEDGAEPILQGRPTEVDVGTPLVLWIIGAAACTIASVLIAKVAGDVVDRQLTRSEDTKKLMSSQAAAVEVVLKHAEREEKAGTQIPYEEAELILLESLLNVQRRIAEKRETPMPTPFAGAARSMDNALGRVGTGLGVALPLAVVGGLFFLLWSQSQRKEG
ncbi:MAG TPA: hypothetical protein VFF45_00715 [Bacilli bacterium]|jgi:hypothetical protein|nr:hypothetical protein [Bacilli bacterium]